MNPCRPYHFMAAGSTGNDIASVGWDRPQRLLAYCDTLIASCCNMIFCSEFLDVKEREAKHACVDFEVETTFPVCILTNLFSFHYMLKSSLLFYPTSICS